MADVSATKPVYRRGTITFTTGQPIQLSDQVDAPQPPQESTLCAAMADALRAYRNAARELLEGQYKDVRELAPPQLRIPCHIYVFCCRDGVLVRYDAAGDETPKVRSADWQGSLADLAPNVSDHMVHVSDDSAYVPKVAGPAMSQFVTNERGEAVELMRIYPWMLAPKTLPADFKLPPPSSRPPCIASINREFQMQIRGRVRPAHAPAGAVAPETDHFVAHGVMQLPVGWQAIEIYPRLGEEFWRPAYAAIWAHLDVLSVIAQRNALESSLYRLDGRGDAREAHAKLLDEFEALLAGPEEPCHQFLKANPYLLCPTHVTVWSKLAFGARVSDFVFREPQNDYLLVEIEAPHQRLFRVDGHARAELTHVIGQIADWLAYIQENKSRVESELGLVGISATPRALVVIGRSAALTESNRRKLATMQTQHQGLTI